MHLNNQRGLTLIEILGTLVILSVIIISIWMVFFRGNDFSDKAITKSRMQQEANQIIYELTNIHQKSDSYSVIINQCDFTVENITNGVTKIQNFSGNRMCISLQNVPTNIIDPRVQNELNLVLEIQDENNPSSTIQIEILLHRLKGANNSEENT